MVFLRATTEPLVGYRLKMRAAVVSWRVRRLRAAAHRKARQVARARNLTLRLWLTALLAVLAGLLAASPAMAETVTFTDTIISDFNAGSLDANTFISQTEDGEVILMPTVGAEFSNTLLPEHWSSCNWSGNDCVTPGSGATVSGGSLHVLGAMASTEATFAPGRSLEFVATFGLASFQHVGLSDNFQTRWAMFSTKDSATGQLYTRTREGGVELVKAIGTAGTYTGSPHRYRIQWEAGQVLYFIDGNLVQTDVAVLASGLNAGASDYNSVGPALSVDWLHVSPTRPRHVHFARLRRR